MTTSMTAPRSIIQAIVCWIFVSLTSAYLSTTFFFFLFYSFPCCFYLSHLHSLIYFSPFFFLLFQQSNNLSAATKPFSKVVSIKQPEQHVRHKVISTAVFCFLFLLCFFFILFYFVLFFFKDSLSNNVSLIFISLFFFLSLSLSLSLFLK
jgi:hypothetical protein